MLVFEKLELNVEGTYRYLGDFSPTSFSCTTAAAAICWDVGVGVCMCNTLAAAVKVQYLGRSKWGGDVPGWHHAEIRQILARGPPELEV